MIRTGLAVLVLTLVACDQPALFHPPVRAKAGVAKTMAITSGEHVTVLAPDGATAEGAIAISPVDARIAIAAGIPEGGKHPIVDTFHSTDGGVTWTAPRPLPLLATSGRTFVGHFDPVLAMDRTGIADLVAIAKETNTIWTTVVYRSTDDGATWMGVDVAQSAAGVVDKPWIAVDREDGTVYALWYSASALRVASSRDRGLTWSEARLPVGGAPVIATGPDRRVYVSSVRNVEPAAYWLYRSDDGGATFGAATQIVPFAGLPVTTMQATPFHQLATDARGNLYMVYPTSIDRHLPAMVMFIRSTDEGRTWSTPLRLSAPPELGRDAAFPALAVDDATGEISVAWLDRRDDPNNQYARVYAARSNDGGLTFETGAFTPPFNVTAGAFLGHYNQLAAHAGRRLAVFSDGAGHLFVARITWPARRRATSR
ncbi:MAG TPA: sialidase family protein [Thermoanaerobaculia bacterium]